jgi:hypothetical protein
MKSIHASTNGLAAIFLITGIVFSSSATAEPLNVHQAIEVADRAIAADAPDRHDLRVVMAKRFSTPHNDLIPIRQSLKPTEYERKILEHLKAREYWCVYYVSKTADSGGDIGIFVDAKSGEVIDIYRGR